MRLTVRIEGPICYIFLLDRDGRVEEREELSCSFFPFRSRSGDVQNGSQVNLISQSGSLHSTCQQNATVLADEPLTY